MRSRPRLHCSDSEVCLQVTYSSLQGIALLLMLGYTMYDLVFDAKLGIIARTLYRAMPDLAHYSVMAMLLVAGITMASHITLGPMLPAFNTFSGWSNTHLAADAVSLHKHGLLAAVPFAMIC